MCTYAVSHMFSVAKSIDTRYYKETGVSFALYITVITTHLIDLMVGCFYFCDCKRSFS